MFKLTTIAKRPGETHIRVEGRLDAQTLPELRSALDAPLDRSAVVVNIAGLSSVDASGRGLLVELRGRGVRLEAGSLYITRLLGEVPS